MHSRIFGSRKGDLSFIPRAGRDCSDVFALPPAVYEAIRALNTGDHESFLRTFAADPILTDWGSSSIGLGAIRGWVWSNRDHQGIGPRIDILGCRTHGNKVHTVLSWVSFGLNCESDVEFVLEHDKVKSISIGFEGNKEATASRHTEP